MNITSELHDFAREFAELTNCNIFLTGKAGTGKTTFLHELRKNTGKQIAVVAPTGVAAINAGGTTIHSFFQLPFTPFIPTPEGKKDLISKLKMQSHRRKVIREVELMVIDEISMVRADLLDAVDTLLRHIRYRNNEPFGGVQMIFIGDMYQLSPVAQSEEWKLLSPYYESIYFFHSRVIQEKPPVYIEFEKIFRQRDMSFISLLSEVRNNNLSEKGMSMLQSRYNPLFVPPKDDTYIILTTHNYKADRINSEELAALKNKSRYFEAQVKGDFPEKLYPIEEKLELKVGAKVMFIKNDTETPKRFFNGKIGKITAFEDETIIVKCPDDDQEIEVSPMVWHNVRYKANETTLQIDEEVLGTFTQFPLRLAWAITIHKSQGLTFDKAVIDAGAAFAPGQVYVALSRCRSLEGMVLLSPINQYSLQNDDKIVRFSGQTSSIPQLSTQLDASKRIYQETLLLGIFDFKPVVATASRWYNRTKVVESSFNSDTLPFIQNIIKQTEALQQVASRFQSQLIQINSVKPLDEELLQNRLQAANGYFSEHLSILTDTLRQTSASTDNRQNANEYDDFLEDIYNFIEQKKHLIKGIQNGFNPEKYFELRHNFVLPLFSHNSYSKTNSNQKISSRHPQLLYQLFHIRNEISDRTGLPIYLIATVKSLTEMADYLPQTERDLLKISGFGKPKVDKYGEDFLNCICTYCIENNLSSEMSLLEAKGTKKTAQKKEKKPKIDTVRVSLELYLEDNTIPEIAKQRNLTEGTITKHLSELVEKGVLKVERFISPEKLQRAVSLLEKNNLNGSVYELLSSVLSQQEVTFMLSWIRGGKKEGKA
ncbi:MAG TPA: AAA family ATPase [Paludibacteraceae bacterium]|nr:AAA family ATPase [Paludibacteraceae bacterium]